MAEMTAHLVGGPSSGPHAVSITDGDPPPELSVETTGTGAQPGVTTYAVYRFLDRAEDGTVVYSFAGKRDVPGS